MSVPMSLSVFLCLYFSVCLSLSPSPKFKASVVHLLGRPIPRK